MRESTLQFFVRDGFLDCYDRYREGVNFAIHAVTFQRAAQDVRECAAECDRMRDSPARGADGCFAFASRGEVAQIALLRPRSRTKTWVNWNPSNTFSLLVRMELFTSVQVCIRNLSPAVKFSPENLPNS